MGRTDTDITVFGFDPQVRAWVTDGGAESFSEVPRLDGTLSVDAAARDAVARDQGNMLTVAPSAVLRPGSAEDVARMVLFCRRHGIQVAAQGQGHTTFGQSLVDGGLVVDTGSLDRVYSVGPEGADVGAGVLWSNLLAVTVPAGLTPPVLTAYTALSVGGTLSFGGISPTNAAGSQIDRVRELEVVTGEGRAVWCSMDEERDLFEAVLGGIGQFGIITRARMDLVPAPSRIRSWWLHYTDNAAFFHDLRILLDRGELRDCYCEMHLDPPGSGTIFYRLVAAVGYEPGQPPDDDHLLRGLTLPPSAAVPGDQTYQEWVLRVDTGTAELQRMVDWDRLVKPWFDMWLANSAIEEYVGRVVPTLEPADIGFGLGFLYAQRRSRLGRPFLVLPEPDGSDWVFMFGVLTTSRTPGPDAVFARRMLDRNRRLYDLAVTAGGTRYPVGSIETTGQDWKRQYGPDWDELCRRKLLFDPDGVLTPGPGIFS